MSVGDAVSVSARVQEFRPGGVSNGNLTTTELASPSVSVLSTGNALPAPTVIGTGGRIPPDTIIDNDSTGNAETSGIFDPDQDGLDFYESLEGMRVQLNDAVAVGPTATGFGETPVDRRRRRECVRPHLPRRPAAPGERRQPGADHAGRPARVAAELNVGDHYSDSIIGVMDYNFGNPFIDVTTTALTANHNGVTRETTRPVAAGELAIATFNFENLAADRPAVEVRRAGLPDREQPARARPARRRGGAGQQRRRRTAGNTVSTRRRRSRGSSTRSPPRAGRPTPGGRSTRSTTRTAASRAGTSARCSSSGPTAASRSSTGRGGTSTDANAVTGSGARRSCSTARAESHRPTRPGTPRASRWRASSRTTATSCS